ncbi:hypothetical protein [Streptomyces sp. LBL]|uniref:hypothetical protein n=1 Tax=Streptomyces sp. LBL TaxID=2940562 RepID=UPI0024747C83|nr:hypothetical protein [Streptomyces sp. LBL]
MGTKTADETGATTGAETTTDEEKVNVTKNDEVTESGAEAGADRAAGDADAGDADVQDADVEDADVEDLAAGETEGERSSGVAQGAGAVVSAALGVVSLTGGWISTVASARETLDGQLHMSQTPSVAAQINVYGDAWHAAALWGGVFALLALIVGVVVLARPAFGAPGRPQAPWIKSVAWGGVALGVIGLLLAVLKYTDLLLGLPSTS